MASSPRSRCQVAQNSLEIDAWGGATGPSTPVSERRVLRRRMKSRIQISASRWRSTLLALRPFLRASSSRWSSSLRKPTMSPSRPTPRSKAKVASATRQPSLTSPTTRSASVRAPSKKTSLNSDVPVSWRMGRTSTPGWSMGTRR